MQCCILHSDGRSLNRNRLITLLALATIGFVGTAAFIHLCMRKPLDLYAAQRNEKLAILAQSAPDVTAASFGSSHIHNGFDPRAFDEVMAEAATPTRTLNLGVQGGSQVEQAVMAKHFLEVAAQNGEAARRRRYLVLLEANAGVNFTDDHMFHPRVINIYDRSAVNLVAHFSDHEFGLTRRIGRVAYGLIAMTLHDLNVGMLSNAIFTPSLKAEELQNETMQDRRGLLTDPFRADDEKHLLEALAKRPPEPVVEKAALSEGLSYLVEELRRSTQLPDVDFAYVVAPMIDDLYAVKQYPPCIDEPFGPVPILDVADPRSFPELYQANMWHDVGHLNEKGAALFTRRLAEKAKAWYADDASTRTCGAA